MTAPDLITALRVEVAASRALIRSVQMHYGLGASKRAGQLHRAWVEASADVAIAEAAHRAATDYWTEEPVQS